jgi:hypothetical protein
MAVRGTVFLWIAVLDPNSTAGGGGGTVEMEIVWDAMCDGEQAV